jgi:signal transduction histidine kinase
MPSTESNRVTAGELAQYDLFRDDSPEALEWLASHFEVLTAEAGTIVVTEGQPANRFSFILEGEIHFGRASEAYGAAFVGKAGMAVGVLPFSRMKVYKGRGVAITHCRVAEMDVAHLPELIYRAPRLTQKLVNEMTDRTRELTQFDERKNKMLALGKLSAGLAHELNNPASAALRSSGRLRDVLLARRKEAIAFRAAPIPKEADALLIALNEHLEDCAKAPMSVDPLERADQEGELGDWLETVGAPAELAGDLIGAGAGIEQLQPLAKLLSPEAMTRGLRILVADYQILCLTGEVEEASKRISDLVQAVKQYSYMDRTPFSQVNIEEGINVTLRMFQHQIKHGYQVKLSYSSEVPPIAANGSELNQIWTNLIDNALDAMKENADGDRVLEIRTAREPFHVLVEVADNGPGMTPDVQSRIFEPFFTTKAVGEGTGLGLDIVRRIVENHKGTIRVTSQPGRTVFEVRLPLPSA